MRGQRSKSEQKNAKTIVNKSGVVMVFWGKCENENRRAATPVRWLELSLGVLQCLRENDKKHATGTGSPDRKPREKVGRGAC